MENELDSKNKKLVSNHLRECKDCKARYEEYCKITSLLAQEDDQVLLGEDFILDTVNKIKENKTMKRHLPYKNLIKMIFFVRVFFISFVKLNITIRWR
jgi:predicted anti-sigma-YlaC factor YlaD